MKNWSSTAGLKVNECPWLKDRQDTLRVAAFLRIPLHTLDFEKQYEKNVLNYFFKEYAAGRTPNPDVMCNKEIKFKLLYNWAIKEGYDFLATGHYAKIGKREVQMRRSVPIHRRPETPINGHATLLRSADEFKDQTYFIYNIKTEQLPHLLFPIGGLKKPAVRALAKKIGLPNADKKESMGLCFVGRIRLKDFLDQKLKAKPGDIVLLLEGHRGKGIGDRKTGQSTDSSLTPHPSPLGRHQGLHYYTIGQRQGIKVGGNGPYYVVRKDLKKNILYVTNNPKDKALEVKEVEIHSVNWINEAVAEAIGLQKKGKRTACSPPVGNGLDLSLQGRYRHQGQLVSLTISAIGKGHYCVTFKKPQKAVASGQSLVLYKGKECVGGGVIV